MGLRTVRCRPDADARAVSVEGGRAVMTAQRKLLAAWLVVGLVPFALQTRSFLKFATPHKITESLVVPPGVAKETANVTQRCSAKGLQMAQAWWNIDLSHYHIVDRELLCHFVVPQYNVHGNYLIGKTRATPFHTTPSDCVDDSYPVELYFYHGSIGFYAFYEEVVGTYCSKDQTVYGLVAGLGTFDMNGSRLAQDAGSDGYRWSYWYSAVGMVWILYRALVLRRSFIVCKRYGRRCDQMQEGLRRKPATIFVHESLRLSAHGATNLQRILLLYLLVEGLMSDLFLLVATEGVFAWVQYISLGYNLSGVLLLTFELVENLGWMRERTRLFIKRLLFSYESSLLGELLSAICQPYFLTSLNRSDLKQSGRTAVAVSYYGWSLVGHGIFVIVLIGFIMSVRALRAVSFVRWKHGQTRAIFMAPCCIDNTLGMRNKMMMLDGYVWEDSMLLYKREALKAFGLLKMEEQDGAEFLLLRKLNWFTVPTEDLCVIGTVSGQCVEPCAERLCTPGLVSFFDRNLGGSVGPGSPPPRFIRVKSKTAQSLPCPSCIRNSTPSKEIKAFSVNC
ncbi:hypothetical protein PHYPSEUDO_002645 [Phytophthora pseudosyringae]|uniref:Transmembrane protein n=1 Tax=Phytophthora pseudosyringae TaxID=221518 RepID=A0A8T1VXS1_9STRA|nr:hypothetical protein PHYPSEUDO_002645 [Phytophthora pseudosyringae]